MSPIVHNCKIAPCPVCGSPDGEGLPWTEPEQYVTIPLEEFERLHEQVRVQEAQLDLAYARIKNLQEALVRKTQALVELEADYQMLLAEGRS